MIKKSKEEYFMTRENYINFTFQCFVGILPYVFASVPSMAASSCDSRVLWLQQRPCGPQTLKYLLSDLLKKIFAYP